MSEPSMRRSWWPAIAQLVLLLAIGTQLFMSWRIQEKNMRLFDLLIKNDKLLEDRLNDHSERLGRTESRVKGIANWLWVPRNPAHAEWR